MTFISLLFAGNVFFIKRLVDKLESTEAIVWELRQQVAILKITIDNMSIQSTSLCRKKKAHYGEAIQEGRRDSSI